MYLHVPSMLYHKNMYQYARSLFGLVSSDMFVKKCSCRYHVCPSTDNGNLTSSKCFIIFQFGISDKRTFFSRKLQFCINFMDTQMICSIPTLELW